MRPDLPRPREWACPVCQELFDVGPLWHCPCCAHHWSMGRDDCPNCHNITRAQAIRAMKAVKSLPYPWDGPEDDPSTNPKGPDDA